MADENTPLSPADAARAEAGVAMVGEALEQHHPAHGEMLASQTEVFGQVIPLPLYTVVFLTLGAITLLEILIAELPEGFIGTSLLLALSAAKVIMVVLFYMHLRTDNRIFAFALGFPLFMAAIAILFLIAVPTTGY